MMHYYFKTRDQLLDVLIDERFAPLRASLGVPFQENPDDPVAAITQLAERLVQSGERASVVSVAVGARSHQRRRAVASADA